MRVQFNRFVLDGEVRDQLFLRSYSHHLRCFKKAQKVPPMKVAFVNNMNNNFFSIVRYLRDRGIDAHLFIFDKIYDGFFPEADTFEEVSSLNYIHLISQISFRDFFNPFSIKVSRAIKKLKKELSEFDLVFVCGMVAFFERAGIKTDVFIPYGGDVYQLTDLFNYSIKKYFPYSSMMRYIEKYQRQAIQKTRAIISFASQDLKIRDAILNMGRQWIDWSMPMSYPVMSPDNVEQWSFLKKHDFVVFSHMRHTWKTGTDYNGNDRAIRGYAQFIKNESRYNNPIFVLFEYGCDVTASKELVKELDIEKYVCWVPAMQRKHIYAGLKRANVVLGIFNEKVISIGGVTYEAFSCELPVIGCAKLQQTEDVHDLPLIHAFEVSEIAAALTEYQKNPGKFKHIGIQSKQWFDRNVGQGIIDRYLELIDLLLKHKNARQEDKELQHLCYQG